MKIRDFVPPVVARVAGAVRRSLASDFARAIDVDDGPDTRDRLGQPYAQSAWVHSALNLIAGELSGRPICWYAGESEYRDPAFLAWWEAPAYGPAVISGGPRPRLSRAQVIRDLAIWAKLEGEFFLLRDDSWLLAGRRGPESFAPFLIANPQRVRLILRAQEIAGYEYIDGAGRRSVWLPEQVSHWKTFNPYDDFRGLGSLQAARVAAEASYHTGTYIRELMRNNGDQGFIIAAKNGVTDDAQREQIIADLRAKRAALRRGTPKDLFVDTDITVDRPKQEAASADLNATKTLSHEEVYVAFGVPPSMAGAKSQYSVGKNSDRYQLITSTCQPLGSEIVGCLQRLGSQMAGRELTAEMEWDDHPVISEVRAERIDTAVKLWGTGMPMQQANAFLGLGMQPYAGWERGYLPFSVAPVNAPEPAPATDPALAEPTDSPPEDDSVASLRALVLARLRCARVAPSQSSPALKSSPSSDPFAVFACSCADHSAAMLGNVAVPAAQRSAWEAQMSKRRPTLKAFQSAFGRVLMTARVEVLRKLSASSSSQSSSSSASRVHQKSAAVDFLFDLAKFAIELRSAMQRQHENALVTAGQQLFDELGRTDPFKYPPTRAVEFVRERANKLSGVPDEIHARIKTQLEEGLAAGETRDQLAARVRGEFNSIDEGRSRVIASTETGAAYGVARAEAMEQAGVQYKAWLTSGNANVRAAHYEAGLTYSADTPIPVDQPFIVGGEALRHPGDPAGSPANVINCHCVSIAVAGPGSDSAA